MTSYADRLAAMDEKYESVEAKVSGGGVPDGDYEGVIQRFDFWQREGGGPLKLLTEITIASGEYAGLSAPTVWHELEDSERIGWTKGYLEMLGLQGVKLSELESKLEPLAGKTRVAIRVKTTSKNGRTFENTYVNEVLGDDGDTFEPPAQPQEEDIPF